MYPFWRTGEGHIAHPDGPISTFSSAAISAQTVDAPAERRQWMRKSKGVDCALKGTHEATFAEAKGYPAAVATTAPAVVDQRSRRAMATLLSMAALLTWPTGWPG
jgi:hypothetical protein